MSTEAAKNATSGKDSPVIVGDHPEDSQASQNVPRSALGIVSESGEILDDAGSAVGSVGDSKDPQELVGKTVSKTGDILSSTGEVLGQAALGSGSDNEQENTDSAYSLVGNDKKVDDVDQHPLEAEKPQTKSETQFDGEDQDIPINLKNNDATDKVADAPKEAEGAAEDLKEVPAEPETAADDAKDTVDDVKDETAEAAPTEEVQNTAEDVKDKTAESAPTEEVKETAEDVKDKTAESAPTEEVKDTAEDVKDKTAEAAPTEEVKETAEDAAEGVKETADDTKDKLADNAEAPEADADKPVEDLKKDAPVDEKDIPDKDAAEEKLPEGGDDKADEAEKKVEDTAAEGQEAAQETTEDATDKTAEATDLAKGAAGAAAETAEEKTEEAAETAEGAKDEVPEAAEKKTDEAAEGAEGAKDEVAVTAEQKTEDATETAEEATDKVEEEAEKIDFSILKGTKVNKAGNLVNSNGDIIGRIVEGDAKKLLGKRADENGDIWDDAGKKVGKAEPLPDSERENSKDFAPFENFPDATVEADGKVTSEGRQVGVVVEGDPKRLKGSKVDEDGDILDRRGNVVGKAEAWDEPEPIPEEPEAVVDKSALAGKRVNKLGNVVDGSGVIYGRVIEGNLQSMIGRMCDKEGNVRSESGDILGKAELVPEGEREGSKEGPFAELSGLTVSKDGKVVTPSGDVVGRLISGDPKILAGRSVDEDGEVVDRNGNVLAKAERWEEPEPEPKKKDFLAGKKVNKEGNVTDEEGNIIGKLVAGELAICSGKEIDDDGDVVNSKGQTIGHVSRLEDIPPEPEKEPEETAEEKAAREAEAEKKKLAENDNELARRLAYVIEETLGKMNPICEKITHKIEQEERKPKEERDEEELVKQVKPLIEEGGKILTETNGAIRGMDPDGRIQRNAKHKSGTKDATPEEHHLAEVLKELTGSVTKCIDGAKKKIDDMPHAKKELSPLWGLLADPLVQILAAVGLLLNGVLGLVGRLLNMLGLGGIVDGILGGLGINKLLTGLGLGDVVGTLTGKNSKDGKQKKGLFG